MNTWTRAIVASAVLLPLVTPCPANGAEDGSSLAIRPDYRRKDIYEVYEGLGEWNQPQFITTDLVLDFLRDYHTD